MTPANSYVGARIIDPSRIADNPCVVSTLIGLPRVRVNLGAMGTTMRDVISAAANHGLRIASFTLYIFLNQSESSWSAIPEARPTKPRVMENLEICPKDFSGKNLFDPKRLERASGVLVSEMGKRIKPERTARPAKIKNVY